MADYSFFAARSVFEVDPARHYLNDIADFLTANPDAWSRGAFARTADGTPCDPRGPDARTFCALGLLQKFVAPQHLRVCELMLSYAITPGRTNRPMSPAAFNDSRARTVADVIAMFRCAALVPAIRRCECAACSGVAAETVGLPLTFSAPSAAIEMPDWLKLATPPNGEQPLLLREELVAA
jgi:hypothetical protein